MKKLFLMTAAAVVASVGTAHAVSFNFESLADSFYAANKYEATWEQAVPGGWWDGGSGGALTVMASVGAFDGNKYVAGRAHAFLDAGNAGLGVCSVGTDPSNSLGVNGEMSLCATGFKHDGSGTDYSGNVKTNDDNVAFPEILKLAFSTTVNATFGLIRNKSHGLSNGSVDIAIDGGGFSTYQIVNGVIQGGGNAVQGSVFWFRPDSLQEGYMSAIEATAVPLPAGMVLLLSGLGALGVARRRRSA